MEAQGKQDAANGTERPIEPLSDAEREQLIKEARSELAELDRKVEENLSRLRELSR